MENNDDNVIKMALPCLCPQCGEAILIEINQPYPLIDILTPGELPEEIQDAIINQPHDTSKEPSAE